MHTWEIVYLGLVVSTFVAFSGTLLACVMAYDRHKAARSGAPAGARRPEARHSSPHPA